MLSPNSIQLADSLAATLWAFVISFILAALVGHIPGLHWRVSTTALLQGSDEEDMVELLGEERCVEDGPVGETLPHASGDQTISPAVSMAKESSNVGM